jgi:hypothetical protein
MQLKTLCSGVEYLVPSLAEHEEVTYSCASVFIRFLSKHRTKLELHLNYTLQTALLLTPKWDGTLPPYPKRERRLCLERVVMLSLVNSHKKNNCFSRLSMIP